VAFANYLAQCLSVIRELCDWFAIVPRLPCPVINGEREMRALGLYEAAGSEHGVSLGGVKRFALHL